MKSVVGVLVCALIACALARPEINQSAVEESRNRIKQAKETCQANPATAVDQAALQEFLQGKGPVPTNAGSHALCISKTLRWQNEDGSVNKSVITEKAAAIFGGVNEKLQKFVDECTVAKATPEETAENLFKCYRTHAPRP